MPINRCLLMEIGVTAVIPGQAFRGSRAGATGMSIRRHYLITTEGIPLKTKNRPSRERHGGDASTGGVGFHEGGPSCGCGAGLGFS